MKCYFFSPSYLYSILYRILCSRDVKWFIERSTFTFPRGVLFPSMLFVRVYMWMWLQKTSSRRHISKTMNRKKLINDSVKRIFDIEKCSFFYSCRWRGKFFEPSQHERKYSKDVFFASRFVKERNYPNC